MSGRKRERRREWQAGRHTDGWEKHRFGQNERKNVTKNVYKGQTVRRWMDGWMDGWMDRQKYSFKNEWKKTRYEIKNEFDLTEIKTKALVSKTKPRWKERKQQSNNKQN